MSRKGRKTAVAGQRASEYDRVIKSIASMSFAELNSLGDAIPTILNSKLQASLSSDDVEKAIEAGLYIEKERIRSTEANKSIFFLPDSIAYSGRGYKETLNRVSMQTLQRMGNLYCVKNIITTRIEQITRFLKFSTDEQKEGFTIRKKRSLFESTEDKGEMTKAEMKRVEEIVDFLEHGGKTDKWEIPDSFVTFVRKIMQDSLSIDQLAFEITRTRGQEIDKFKAVDGSMIRFLDSVDPDYAHEFERYRYRGYLPKYCQVFDQQIVFNKQLNEYVLYYPWELGFGIRNIGTDIWNNGYGRSELETLVEIVTYILNGVQYNGNFFKNGSNPKGFVKMNGPNANQTQLNDFKQKWRQMLTGVDNCLAGDSLLVLKNIGVTSIEDFLNGSQEKEAIIWTGKNFEYGRVYRTGLKKKCTLTLANGLSITSSDNHKFKVVSDSGIIEWKERKDLKVGDFVLCNKKPVEGTRKFYYKGKVVENDLFEILGWLTGDGYIDNGESRRKRMELFYHSEKELHIREQHLCVLNRYGINAKSQDYCRSFDQIESCKKVYGFKSVADKYCKIGIFDADFYEFLIGIGFTCSHVGKVIPPMIHDIDSESRCAFLRGFFSADGSVVSEGLGVRITISSDLLRYQTRMLLISEGIQCSIEEYHSKTRLRKSDKKGIHLLVKDRREFYERIGFLQPHKQLGHDYKKNYSTMFSLHPEMGKLEAKKMRVELYRRWVFGESGCVGDQRLTTDLHRISIGKDKCSYQRLTGIAERIGYKLHDEFSEFWFSPIVELSSFDEEIPMYDVEIYDNKHQFIVNGMLTHNSHKIPIFAGLDIEWVDLQKGNRDMEFDNWTKFLIVMLCSVYRIDPSELGFQFKDAANLFGQQGQKERLDHSKQKGLYPLLIFLQDIINKFLISELDEDMEFAFTGIEVEDEEKQVKLDADKLSAGMVAMQDMFKKYSGRDFDPEKDIILNQVYQTQKQSQMFGGDMMNGIVDDETGEPEAGIPNPFEDVGKSVAGNPIFASACEYIDKNLGNDGN